MSFEINGVTWQPKTAVEHADAIIDRINAIFQENNTLDSEGNVIQLRKNYGNALYLLALGDGERMADNDVNLSKAINSFNIALCDDQQIENLLPIAAVTRNPGSYSTLILTVKASYINGCLIPKGTKAPYGNVNFIVQNDVVLTAGATQNIETVCDTVGPVAVLTGEITKFETSIPNLESVVNPQSSTPGIAAESTNDLRKRLIKGNTIRFSLDGVKNALEELTGISYARVYFNYNTDAEMTLPGNVNIKPRTAYIVVFGNSPDLAKVYAEYMNAPTQNAPGAAVNFQEYVSLSGQKIPIYFDQAEKKTIYVKIVLKENAEIGIQVDNQLKKDLILSSANWKIGEEISSLTTSVPFADIAYTEVAYTLVSEDGETWENTIEIGCNVVPQVTDESIIIE